MPKWVLRRTDTTPMPNSRAIAIASCIARMPTTKPKPFRPSKAAATGVTRSGASDRPRIDQAAAEAVEIAGQAAEAVGVDAAQIGAHQAAGNDRRVLLRQAMRDQQAPGEGVRRAGVRHRRGALLIACGADIRV